MRPLLRAAGLACVSAVLFGLTFPPTGWKAVSWFAVTPLLLALRLGGIGQALFIAWLWCVVGATVAGDWFPKAVASYFGQPLVVALALFVAVFTFMAGPYFMAFAAVYRALARRFGGLALVLLTAAAWTGAELGRGRLFTGTPFFIGNPWGLAGYALVDWLPLVQIASVTGIYGVSFAVVCVNAALAELWLSWRDTRVSRSRTLAVLAASAVPTLGCLAFGSLALWGAESDPEEVGAPAIPVAVIQGNLDVGSRWRREHYGRNLDVYLELTYEAAQQEPLGIAFWPEAAMTFFYESEPLYQRAIASLLRAGDTELVAGAPRREESSAPRYFNSIYSIGADGLPRGRYDKQYLVPFAEYFPLGVDVLRRHFGRVRYFEHGSGDAIRPIPTRAGLAGVLVCNESMLPEVAAERVNAGAAYLVNPSNDSWISDEKYAEEQFDIAIMRAIEQRRYLVRASTAGPSAVVDPWGRVQSRSRMGTREVVRGAIRARSEVSLYGRLGDSFSVACIAIVALALLVRRSRGPSEGISGGASPSGETPAPP
jgi:apolipoprotein N-acyltransferase